MLFDDKIWGFPCASGQETRPRIKSRIQLPPALPPCSAASLPSPSRPHPPLSLLPHPSRWVTRNVASVALVTIPRVPFRTGHIVQGMIETNHEHFLLPASLWPKAKGQGQACAQQLLEVQPCPGLSLLEKSTVEAAPPGSWRAVFSFFPVELVGVSSCSPRSGTSYFHSLLSFLAQKSGLLPRSRHLMRGWRTPTLGWNRRGGWWHLPEGTQPNPPNCRGRAWTSNPTGSP